MKNTLKKGSVRIISYKDKKDETFYATALEFNLTVDAQSKEEALLELKEAVLDYVKIANDLNDPSILNQNPDVELEKMWEDLINNRKAKASPYYKPLEATIVNNYA